jgi:hypothetical protein
MLRTFKLTLPSERKAFAKWVKSTRKVELRDIQAEYVCNCYKWICEMLRWMRHFKLKRFSKDLRCIHPDVERVISLLPGGQLQNLLYQLSSMGGLRTIVKELEIKKLKRNAAGRPDAFMIAVCAVKLTQISLHHTGSQNLPWVEEWLRKAELPGWQARNEQGCDGKAVQNLIRRHEKRWNKGYSPPPLRFNPPVTYEPFSPDEAERSLMAFFSLLAERGVAVRFEETTSEKLP